MSESQAKSTILPFWLKYFGSALPVLFTT